MTGPISVYIGCTGSRLLRAFWGFLTVSSWTHNNETNESNETSKQVKQQCTVFTGGRRLTSGLTISLQCHIKCESLTTKQCSCTILSTHTKSSAISPRHGGNTNIVYVTGLFWSEGQNFTTKSGGDVGRGMQGLHSDSARADSVLGFFIQRVWWAL